MGRRGLAVALCVMAVTACVDAGAGSPNLVKESIPTDGCNKFLELAKSILTGAVACEMTTTDPRVLCRGREYKTVDPVEVIQRTQFTTCDVGQLEGSIFAYDDSITFPKQMLAQKEMYLAAKTMTRESHEIGWGTTVYASEALQFYKVMNTLMDNRLGALMEVGEKLVRDGIEPSLDRAVTDAIAFIAMLVWDMKHSKAVPQGQKLIRKGTSMHEQELVESYFKAQTPLEWKSFMSTSNKVVDFGARYVVWQISDEAGCAKDITESKELFSEETEYLLYPGTILDITRILQRPKCNCKDARGRFKHACLKLCYKDDPPYKLVLAKTTTC